MAKRRLKWRGRSVVAVVLLAFLVVTTAIVWRRSLGHTEALELQKLSRRIVELKAERAKLQTELVSATSRSRLGPLVEQRLGMRVPADSQSIDLPRPARPAARTPDDS
jgi:cell division protein FtsL